MKRLAIILCLLALLCMGMLVACDEETTTDCTHSAKEWVEEVAASCTVDGTVGHYVCKDCQKTLDADGKELSDLSIPAAHSPKTEWSAEDGKHYHACANCDKKFDEAECSGGTATCTERATCTTCGNAYGEEPSHAPASDWTTENGQHYHACANCDDKLDLTTCGGGRASCTERAECSVCGKVYGPEPSHAPSSDWTTENGKHYHACANCTTHLDEAPCSGGTATCTARAECSTCHRAYGPEPSHDPDDEWTTENGQHYHACANCDDKLDLANCDGGTATCTERAECSVCHEKYGETAPHEYLIQNYDDDHHWMECACEEKGPKTAHNYTSSVVTPPTCTEEGYTTYSCACGHSYTDDETEPAGHKYADTWSHDSSHHWHAATCGCVGEKKDYAPHNLVANVTAPTCTLPGYTVYTCTCGYESEPTDTVPATGHTPDGDWVETGAELLDASTCTYTVHFRVECSECDGHDTKTETIPRHATYEKTVTSATCQESGRKSVFCASEDCVYHTVALDTYDYTDAEAHVWKVVPSASNETMTVYECELCDATKTQSSGNSANISSDALGNTSEIELGGNAGGNIVIGIDDGIKESLGSQDISISASTLDAESAGLTPEQKEMLAGRDIFDFTITANGFDGSLGGYATIRIPYVLQSGDDPNSIIVWFIDTQTGKLTPHEAVYAVDANGNGYVSFKTDHFSYYTVDSIDPAEICQKLEKHDETNTHVVAPTCTTGGYTVCLRCGEQIEGSATPAHGHNIGALVIREATCAESGLVRYTCSDCGLSYEVVIPAIGHDYVKTAQVTATCQTVGSETFSCTHCGDSYTVTFPKLSHTYHEREVAPTCSTNGYVEKTCTACGSVVRMGLIPATGHTPSSVWYAEKDGHYHVCLDCGERMDEDAHIPGAPATEQTAQICTVCEYTVAPPVQHVHVLSRIDGVEPTCTESGHITYYTCACGTWFADADAQMKIEDHTAVILGATKHASAVATPYVAPSCETDGYTDGIWCPDCETYLRGHVKVSAYGHDYHATVSAPTCTEDGSIVYICAHCTDEDEAAKERIAAPGHTLRAIVTAATCTEGGYTTYTCTRCKYSEEHDHTEALGHRFVSAFSSDENGHWHTCVRCAETTEVEAHLPDYPEATTEHGVKCAKCNYLIADAIAHTHAPSVTVPEKAPTCTASGNMAYYVCSCGQWFADEACTETIYNRESVVLAALGHTPSFIRAVSATCTDVGYTSGIYCDSCESYLSGHEEIPATGHSLVQKYDTKFHWHECSVCGEKENEDLHTPIVVNTVQPNCEEYGYTEFACECGHSYEGDRVRPLGHDFGEWQDNGDGTHTRVCSRDNTHTESGECRYTFEIVPSTCETEGYVLYTCMDCGHSYRDNVTPAHGHVWGDWSYKDNGEHQRFCMHNGTHVETAPCDMVTEVIEPTCTHRGYTTHTCRDCGHSETTDVTSALGHDYGDWYYIGGGQHECRCKNDETHTMTDFCRGTSETVPATCETYGYTVHICESCGNLEETDVVPAFGHSYGEWNYIGDGKHQAICQNDASHTMTRSCITMAELVLASCTEDGYTRHTCTGCGNVEITDVRPATGHRLNPLWSYNGDGTHTAKCLYNKCTYSETEKCEETVNVVAPDCVTGGYTEFTCFRCQHSYTADETPATGHSFDENGICSGCGTQAGILDELLREELQVKAKDSLRVLRRVLNLSIADETALSDLQNALNTAKTAEELESAWEAFGMKIYDILASSDDELATVRFEVLFEITVAWEALPETGVDTSEYKQNFNDLRARILEAADEKSVRAVLDAYEALVKEIQSGNAALEERRKSMLSEMERRWNTLCETYEDAKQHLMAYENYVSRVNTASSIEMLNFEYDDFNAWIKSVESTLIGVDEAYRKETLAKMSERWAAFVEKNDGSAYESNYQTWYDYVQYAYSNDAIASHYEQFEKWMSAVESGEWISEADRSEVHARMKARLAEAEAKGVTIDKANLQYLNDLMMSVSMAQTRSELDALWEKFEKKLSALENAGSDDDFPELHEKAKAEVKNLQRALTYSVTTMTAEQSNELKTLRQNINNALTVDELTELMNDLYALVEEILADCDEMSMMRYELATYMLTRIDQVAALGYDVNMLNQRITAIKNAMDEEELRFIFEDFEMEVEMITGGALLSEQTRRNVLDEMERNWNSLPVEYFVTDEQRARAEAYFKAAREALTLDELYDAQNGLSVLIFEIRNQNGAVNETLRADTLKNMYSRWYRIINQFDASALKKYEAIYQNYYNSVSEASSNDEITSIFDEFTAWMNDVEKNLKEEDTSIDEERQAAILAAMGERYYAYTDAHGYDGDVQGTYYEWLTRVQYAKTDAEIDEYFAGFTAWMDALEGKDPGEGGDECKHVFKTEMVRKPTCTQEGFARDICIYCDMIMKEYPVPMQSHSVDASGTCTSCGSFIGTPTDTVVYAYISKQYVDIDASYGYTMEDVIQKYLLGEYVVLEWSMSGQERIPITYDMLSYEEYDLSKPGDYFVQIRVMLENYEGYFTFSIWVYTNGDVEKPDDPALDEELRMAYLNEMEWRWKEYTANGSSTEEQYMEFEDWYYRAKCATTVDELEMIMRDFNTWIKDLESNTSPSEPKIWVYDWRADITSTTAREGTNIQSFLKENVLGREFYLYLSDGTVQTLRITHDMVSLETMNGIFEMYCEYELIISAEYNGDRYNYYAYISVLPDMTGVKIVGEYVVDPALTGSPEEWKVVLYENGFADLMIGGAVQGVAEYTLDDGILSVTAEGSMLLFVTDEESGTITTYIPNENLIGTYYYYNTTFEVYGDYQGPGAYICVVIMMSDDGMVQCLTGMAWLDLDKCMFSCSLMDDMMLYFDENGNLSRNKPGEDNGEIDKPTLDEAQRDAYLNEMEWRWNDYAANGSSTEEQYMEFEDWYYRLKCAMTIDELEMIMRDFNTWIKDLESNTSPSIWVYNYYAELGSMTAKEGTDIEQFLAESVLGRSFYLYFSDGTVQTLCITRDMVSLKAESNVFEMAYQYELYVCAEYDGQSYICNMYISVLPDMTGVKIVGEYVVDPALTGSPEEWKVVLYENGFADLMMDGAVLGSIEYTLDDGVISLMGNGMTVLLTVNEAGLLTSYIPDADVIGTYYYYDTMFEVYGDYQGPGAYLCVVTMMGDGGMPVRLTGMAWLDLDKCMFSCSLMDGMTLYFDENGNLTEKIPGEDSGENGEEGGEIDKPDDPIEYPTEDVDALRNQLLSAMQKEWKLLLREMNGDIAPHFESEYQNILDRMTWETDRDMMMVIYDNDFCLLVQTVRSMIDRPSDEDSGENGANTDEGYGDLIVINPGVTVVDGEGKTTLVDYATGATEYAYSMMP